MIVNDKPKIGDRTVSFDVDERAEGVNPEQMMGLIADWATQHTTLTPEQTARIKDMLKAHASRLEVFVHVAADQRARMLARLFPWSERIDRELFDPRRLQTATTEELLRAAEVINRRIESNVDFLKDLIERPQPQFIQEAEREIRELTSRAGAVASLSPERREDLRALLMALAKQVGNKDGVTNSQPEVVSGGTKDVQESVPGREGPPHASVGGNGGGEPDYTG